ncbi:hypothetical protein [Helicobacter cetorum]|uniref:Uncharacterized protein n=1 Tax=Helicobacter cetorum (strain ATCC BAA-429 / MIT 00-7128) TaxID=182217 RepID=I0EPX7_HELC0|nr:hypothetical protein [Helicobacter cetorum]AFI04996.1 hypothetical protein HCW_08705 [Helicobacter cetorum MIT 00-7128]
MLFDLFNLFSKTTIFTKPPLTTQPPYIPRPTTTFEKVVEIAGKGLQAYCERNNARQRVVPKVGSIVLHDLFFDFAEHSGVYLGDNKIAHLTRENNKALLKIVSPKDFVKGFMKTSSDILMLCYEYDEILKPLHSQKIADNALYFVERYKGIALDYAIMRDEFNTHNCHAFSASCILGKDLNQHQIWSLEGVRDVLRDKFNIAQNDFLECAKWDYE